MFNKNRTRSGGGSFGRFSGGKSSGFGGRSSGGRSFGGRSSGGRSSGRRGGAHRGQYIDVSKYVNKVTTIETAEVFTPEHMFKDFNIDERLKANVIAKGFSAPTPIQDKSIPHILRGSDIVGIANTGTGKTGAFAIPLIQKALTSPKEAILVVVPTRELALQIEQEIKSLIKGLKIYSVCCVGGAHIGRQISELRYFNNFVIGTPGRLMDLADRGFIKFSEFSTIVLDEADRMLDMGFIGDIKLIVSRMPKKRHTLFFSATMSREIENLISEFLTDPVSVSVKTRDTSKNIDQDVVKVSGKTKIETLHNLLNDKEFHKVLIFGRTKHGVEELSVTLNERGFKAESIHGDKNHAKRQKALALFKDNRIKVLVATDVAARGLDIPDVSHVINYDIPATYEDYIHRIGRTGRGNKKGKALTFIG